jgi:hypothetical protein
MNKDIINKLTNCLKRKLIYKRLMKVTLNRKHQEQLERYIRKSALTLDHFKCLAGYRILGMRIICKEE